MGMKHFFIGIVCLALCGGAMASDNYLYGGEISDKYYWIHEESILNLDNGNTSFFAYVVNINPKLSYDLSVEEVEVRCKSREVKEINSTTFLKGKMQGTKEFNNSWWRTRPGSVGDAWRKIVCDKSERETTYHKSFSSQDELTEWTQNYLREKKAKEQKSQSQPVKPEPKKIEPKPVKKAPSELDLL